LGITLLVFAAPAFAGDLSYNYVQLGYQKIDFDDDIAPGVSIDGDGFGIAGSFEIGESWFVGLGYAKSDFDFGIDLEQTSLGLGWHGPISDKADVFATLSYVQAEVSASGFGSVDDDGYGVSVGVRGMVSERFELGGSLGYVDFGDGDGTSFGANALYSITETFAAGVFVETDDDITSYGVGLRVYW
jgi:outer membrane protein assembly factor BamA